MAVVVSQTDAPTSNSGRKRAKAKRTITKRSPRNSHLVATVEAVTTTIVGDEVATKLIAKTKLVKARRADKSVAVVKSNVADEPISNILLTTTSMKTRMSLLTSRKTVAEKAKRPTLKSKRTARSNLSVSLTISLTIKNSSLTRTSFKTRTR